MNDLNFNLIPAYCLYNGVVVLEQQGAYIKFLMEETEDNCLKERLKKAFLNYINEIKKRDNCPESFKDEVRIDFVKGERSLIRKYVSSNFEKNNIELVDVKKPQQSKDLENESAAVLLLDRILLDARQKGATDIHIEKFKVRFRVCGLLENYCVLTQKRALELGRRIKLLSGLNVLEKRKSQDGNFVYGDDNPVFIRVSTVSIISDSAVECDESIVLRLLDPSRIVLDYKSLGFSCEQINLIEQILQNKNGLVLVCGPTGSGKSTTSAALLVQIDAINDGKRKIISLEDPPEYVLKNICQMKVGGNGQPDFDEALVHIFRQDPDVIMIGEIRDKRSALAAMRASLTGHLVIATLHTFSVFSALLRMENLGIERGLFASVLRGIIVQELNYYGSQVNLLVEVSVPNKEFAGFAGNIVDEKKIEEFFTQVNNYSQVAGASLKKMVETKNYELKAFSERKMVKKAI